MLSPFPEISCYKGNSFIGISSKFTIKVGDFPLLTFLSSFCTLFVMIFKTIAAYCYYKLDLVSETRTLLQVTITLLIKLKTIAAAQLKKIVTDIF